ncbi:MAG: Bax inhibitor-1/YccA family protein [Bdellovibrionales bacterium]
MRSANPALSDKAFQGLVSTDQNMTISGTVQKSFLLILMVFASATWSWSQAFPSGWGVGVTPEIPLWYFPAIIGGFVVAMVIIFKKNTAPYLAPVYAVLEGATLGAISALFEFRYPGIVLQAVFCTFGTFLALLFAYQSKLIQATENFKLGVVAATGGIAIVYLVDMALRFFGMSVPFIHESGPLGIGISAVIVVVAALNLVLDFDFIESASNRGAPKHMEWYGAFGLLVTLIWLYLEILRLLSKMQKK